MFINSSDIYFVLVSPAVPENIGASARALKTMGFSNLRLVNPADYTSDKAKMLAHGSHDVLLDAEVFPDLKSALQDIDFAIAASAKNRRVKHDYYSLKESLEILTKKEGSLKNLAFVFGGEESGLSNTDINLCNLVSYVPLKTTFPSLNLAQAVMLYAYEISNILALIPKKEHPKTVKKQLHRIYLEKSKSFLEDADFNPDSTIFNRILERLNVLGKDDIHLILSILEKVKKS